MESILKSIKTKKIPINPAIVISNNSDAKGLRIAKKMGINVEIVESKNFKGNRTEYDKKIMSTLSDYGVTPKNGLVCLAGFMRIISPGFVKKYKNRIINIHPALLPAFPGLNSQKQALDYGAKYSGCTVTFCGCRNGYRSSDIQAIVKIKEKDTEKSLSKKFLKEEHRIYPEAVNLIARKKSRFQEEKHIFLKNQSHQKNTKL